MKLSELSGKILAEIGSILHQIDNESVGNFLDGILSSERIFIAGVGRSGLVARSFAMRLMQMGLQVYVVGEVTTPAIGSKDLLVAISGSGETATTHHIASKARDNGAHIFLITSRSKSKIGDTSDLTIVLPDVHEPVLALKSAFEASTYLFFDAVVIMLMEKTGIKPEEMMKRHSNLE